MKKIIALLVLFLSFSCLAETKLLKFYADWCPPCKKMSPIVEKVAKDLNIVVKEIDVDKESQVAEAFGVDRIPTLILVKDGKLVLIIVGVVKEETLKSELKSVL